MANTIRKTITVANHKFVLEIYPKRETSKGPEGPYYEFFPQDYKGCLYAFSNKEEINNKIQKNYLK